MRVRGSTLLTVYSVIQYPIALVTAFLFSVVTFLLLIGIVGLLAYVCAGFAGVFGGGLFLKPSSRLFGSLFLLLLGSGHFYLRFVSFNEGPGSLGDQAWPCLIRVFCGGIGGVIGHWILARLRWNTGENIDQTRQDPDSTR
jgi:hypothetical protein